MEGDSGCGGALGRALVHHSLDQQDEREFARSGIEASLHGPHHLKLVLEKIFGVGLLLDPKRILSSHSGILVGDRRKASGREL